LWSKPVLAQDPKTLLEAPWQGSRAVRKSYTFYEPPRTVYMLPRNSETTEGYNSFGAKPNSTDYIFLPHFDTYWNIHRQLYIQSNRIITLLFLNNIMRPQTMQSVEDQGQNGPLNLEFLINYRISRMLDAEEKRDWWRYFVNFKFIFLRLLMYVEPNERMISECEWRMLEYNISRIREDAALNDQAKKDKVLNLQRDFANAHMAQVYLLFPKANLAVIKEDGEIDFDLMRWEAMKGFLTAGAGHKANLNAAMKRQRGLDDADRKRAENILVGNGGDADGGDREREGGNAPEGEEPPPKGSIPASARTGSEGTDPGASQE